MFKGLLSEIADSITYMNSYVKLGVGDKVLVNTYGYMELKSRRRLLFQHLFIYCFHFSVQMTVHSGSVSLHFYTGGHIKAKIRVKDTEGNFYFDRTPDALFPKAAKQMNGEKTAFGRMQIVSICI